jgi:hypothetical protein
MRWIFRLLFWLALLAGLIWGAVVLIAPGQIKSVLDDRFQGQIAAQSVAMSWTGQITLTDVTLQLPEGATLALTQLRLRPIWQTAGLGLQVDGDAATLSAPQMTAAAVTGQFFPASYDRVAGPFDVMLSDVALPQGRLATARLRGKADVPAQELTNMVFTSTDLDLDLAAPVGALDVTIAAMTLTSARLSPGFVAPLAVEITGVTGDVLQGAARLWVAGLKDARITLDTLEMPLGQDPVPLVLRAETTAPTTPALTAWIESETDLTLIRGAGCAEITCARGLAGLRSQNRWEVVVGEDSTRGGFTCEALPCFPGALRYDPVEVTDVQAFATGLGTTRVLSPFVLGFVAAELSKVARPQE